MPKINQETRDAFEAMVKVHCRNVHLGQDKDGVYVSTYTRDMLALYLGTRRQFEPKATFVKTKETT